MKYNIKKNDLKQLITKVLKESVGIPSEENHYISIMVPRIKSWMDEVYQDWGGIDAVSPEALTDFSNRNDYEDTLDTFAHEFNVDREELRPTLNKAIEIAHNKLKEDLLGEGREVKQFTPYTPEEKACNFEYLRTGFGRSPEERNPSYAAAKKAAEERRKQKQQAIESITESPNGNLADRMHHNPRGNYAAHAPQHIGAERAASNNDYANRWVNQYARPLFNMADKAIAEENVEKMTYIYKRLVTLLNCHPLQADARLMSAKERIRSKAQELVKKVQYLMMNHNESKVSKAVSETINEWKKKAINEDGYSYNGLDQQEKYRKMGEELYNEQQRKKNYKKNMVFFKRAFNKVYKEFTIIGTLKRKSEEAKEVFNGPSFIKFVEHTEGETLYEPIWEKYGGEYLEMANIYLESYVVKFRRKLGI